MTGQFMVYGPDPKVIEEQAKWMAKTGGPAFPAPAGVAHITEQGMTLRDYYAGLAMQGHAARTDWDTEDHEFYSNWAYEMADAMLKARNK